MPEQQIRCRSVLTGDGWLGPASILVAADGMIRSITQLAENTTVDYGHIIPGMPNLHSHSFQRQMAGLTGLPGPEGDSFWTWRERMYHLAARIQPDQLRVIAACLQAEMLEHGYTSCAEFHYLHHQPDGTPYDNRVELSSQIVAAAEQSGMALTLLPVMYCRSGFDSVNVTGRQMRFRNTTAQYLELWQACKDMLKGHELHRSGLAFHSLRAVSPEQMTEVLDLSDLHDQPIHIHVSEQPAEVTECLGALGARPVQWLTDQHEVNEQWCLVHATHTDTSEKAALLRSNAVVGICPSTEADLGDGYFDITSWFEQSGKFGIGSDSNLRLSVIEELRMLEFQARLQSGKRNVLAENGCSFGRSLFQRALAGGAQALAQKVGRLEPNFRADLVELDAEHLMLCGRTEDTLLDTWILAGEPSMIRSVWVGGKKQVQDGRHVARDALDAACRTVMMELM